MAPAADSPPHVASASDKFMRHTPKAQQTFSPPLIAYDNAVLGDIYSSSALPTTIGDKKPRHPISAGFFHLKPGTPLEYTYTYDEMKIVLEGEFVITDLQGGNTVTAGPGDVFFFPEGSVIKFETSGGAKAFYTGQRKEGAA